MHPVECKDRLIDLKMFKIVEYPVCDFCDCSCGCCLTSHISFSFVVLDNRRSIFLFLISKLLYRVLESVLRLTVWLH